MNKWFLAALGIFGVGALIFVMREKSSASQPNVLPIPTAAPLSIPPYPQAAPLPDFTVNATPTYMTVNVAPPYNANAQAAPDTSKQGDCSSCTKSPCDAGTIVPKQIVSDSRMRFSMNNLQGLSNLQQQFPPALYPWLYQNGGSA